MSDIVERLKSNEPLPICPFDSKSPSYWTTPDDKPCPFCGQENTTEGPDKCRGADTRLFAEAADEIMQLRKALEFYKCGCKKDSCTPEKPKFRNIRCGWIARAALKENE